MTANGDVRRVTAILNPESVRREDVDTLKNQYLEFFDEKKVFCHKSVTTIDLIGRE
jgi:hypothetical protein